MVKIKRKVEMKHGDFAKYMVDKFGFLSYESKLTEGDYVGSPSSRFDISLHLPSTEIDDLPLIQIMENGVVIETSEEITEDTEIPKLMTTFKKTCLKGGIGYQRVRIDENYSIKLMLNRAEEHKEPIETLHVVNDDGTHTLIWREGKLVEYMENKIDENTVLPKLIEIDVDGVRFEWNNKSINEIKNYQTKTIHAVIYGEFKLVWEKYKGLVE